MIFDDEPSDQGGTRSIFQWELSRQADGELAGCWLTDGVQPIGSIPVFLFGLESLTQFTMI